MIRQSHRFSLILIVLVLAVVPAAASIAADGQAQPPLGFEERVAAFELIEDVYWSHRIWPEANPAPKPRRDEVMSHAQVVAKVERSLLLEAALQEVWGQRLTPDRIQIELNRIVKTTRHPAILADVFSALDHDPVLIAECYVRPRLVERLVTERYAWDKEIHRELRDRVVAELAGARKVEDIHDSSAVVSDVILILADGAGLGDVSTSAELRLAPDEWQSMLQKLAGRFQQDISPGPGAPVPSDSGELLALQVGRGVSPFFETDGGFYVVEVLAVGDGRLHVSSATWPKLAFADWLTSIEHDLNPTTPEGGSYALPKLATGDPCIDDTWAPTAGSSPPSPRSIDSLVWTGTEMIVWGGHDGSSGLNTGGRYDPATDSWTATAVSGATDERQSHRSVWTGAEMIVWGGYSSEQAAYLNTGSRYDPATDSWTSTTPTDAPSTRSQHGAVWTGTEMVVWGGYGGSNLNTGGRYNPVTDSWTATSTTGAPPGRYGLSAVWTGDEMIVWGGLTSATTVNSGGRYNPGTDSWVATSGSGAPSARQAHTAVWTGSEMVVWGGLAGTATNTGGRYDPVGDTWTPTSTSGAPTGRWAATAVWTGTEVTVWGGNDGVSDVATGGRYNPATESWTATTIDNAPTGRRNHKSVWTGSEMIVWGGKTDSGELSESGGRYNPTLDSWTATSTTAAPSARQNHQVVWTGTEMIVWGGNDGDTSVDSGGRYCASGVLGIDHGDAPDPTYPTLSASDGARHPFDGVLYLGSLVDGEADGQPTASADGDDLDGTDDDDGVTLTSALRLGLNATLDITASATGLLNAWVDFNADGDWNDAGEQVFTDTALTAGSNSLQVAVPLDAMLGTTFARFRCDSTGGLAPTGLAADGEVEDYALTLEPSAELAVTIADEPDPVAPGSQLRYFVEVTNNGLLEATGVVLTDTLDASTSFVSASLPACSESSGAVTCTLGAISAGASTVVEIEVNVNVGFTGILANAASVALNEDDPITANNVESENTTVDPAVIFSDGFETGGAGRWSSVSP